MCKLTKTEIERRIKIDFPNDYDCILLNIRDIMPDVSEEQIKLWENSKALEYVVIDGRKMYFRRAVRNLFRIDSRARSYYIGKYEDDRAARAEFLAKYLPEIIGKTDQKVFDFRFTLSVKPDVVPEGETIRCWLPSPAEYKYQTLISPHKNVKNPVHSTVYYEQTAQRGKPTVFSTRFRFRSRSFFYKTDGRNQYDGFDSQSVAEQPPHIVFTEPIRRLSEEIVGNEKDKHTIAKRIFTWISDNIPWAAAREYSTIDNIPEYVLHNRHGDCGQVTLLFMTLCRYNGIPARWVSGFMLHPAYENLHDWCEIYLDSTGWVPVDVSFGIQRYSKDEDIRYFYFMGIDAYRLVVNRGISGELSPPKTFERSECVDFQRGEVEWRGGNIYFDSFDYNFTVTEVSDYVPPFDSATYGE